MYTYASNKMACNILLFTSHDSVTYIIVLLYTVAMYHNTKHALFGDMYLTANLANYRSLGMYTP